jgi:hypothetical protein
MCLFQWALAAYSSTTVTPYDMKKGLPSTCGDDALHVQGMVYPHVLSTVCTNSRLKPFL